MVSLDKMNLSAVPTPEPLNFINNESKTIYGIGSALTKEIKCRGCWTDGCSKLMIQNPKVLFLYDRFKQSLGNAYRNSIYKIALNPMMLICYYPDCLKKIRGLAVKLKYPFFLQTYLYHLHDHLDDVGKAMQLPFYAVNEESFMSSQSLDRISLSPHLLQSSPCYMINLCMSFRAMGLTVNLM